MYVGMFTHTHTYIHTYIHTYRALKRVEEAEKVRERAEKMCTEMEGKVKLAGGKLEAATETIVQVRTLMCMYISHVRMYVYIACLIYPHRLHAYMYLCIENNRRIREANSHAILKRRICQLLRRNIVTYISRQTFE